MEGEHRKEIDTISTSTDININTEDGSGCAYKFCHPERSFHRFIALIFICFLGFGSYFCYDNPGVLQDNIRRDLNITTTEYTLLYSLYSWPNVVLCFIGGFLIDRVFGIRLGANLYMILLLIGQGIFAAGAIFDIFWLMLVGRFIFGIGGESLAVAQNNYAVLWFKGKELNMVFGLQLSIARIGDAANSWVMEPLYQLVNKTYSGHECLGIVFFIAGLTCIGSLVCSLVLSVIDKRAERILRRNENESGEVIKLTDVRHFPAQFWLLAIICLTYYSAIFPFTAVGKTFFMEKFQLPAEEANHISSLVYRISFFRAPLLGFVVDKTGKNIFWIFTGILLTIGAHTLMAFTYVPPHVGMTMMGTAYSLLASGLWPLVAFVIPESHLGTAYGMMQAIQNLGLFVVSILVELIVETLGYTWMEIFFLNSLIWSFAATLLLYFLNIKRNGTLNMTPSQRDMHQQGRLDAEEREQLLTEEGPAEISNDGGSFSDFEIKNRYLTKIGATEN